MPTIDQFEWFLKTGSIYGLGFLAIAGMLFLVFYGTFWGLKEVIGLIQDVREKHLPNVVNGHMGFISTSQSATVATSVAVAKLAEGHTTSGNNHDKTHRVLRHITLALSEGDVCEEAKAHLRDAIQELNTADE